MNVVAFSGLHGNRDLIDIFIASITHKKLHPDIFICVGDIGDSIIVELFKKIQRFNKPILFVLGNHTLHDDYPKEVKKAEKLTNVFHLKNDVLQIDEYEFIGQDAWTDFTDEEKSDRVRFKDLSKKFKEASLGKSILLTHHAPLGILDRRVSYPFRSWQDKDGHLHSGSFAIRQIVEKYKPSIHLLAHAHSDGGKWELYNKNLFANVCHLERITRSGKLGVNGSFMVIDTDQKLCIPHHLNKLEQEICSCGAIHYLNYRKCINCYGRRAPIIDFRSLEKYFEYNIT